MSVSGTGPLNMGPLNGASFRSFSPRPVQWTGGSSALEQKITRALSEQRNSFDEMQAAELKKRVAFYSRFEGTRDGNRALGEIAYQIGAMIRARSASEWTV